MGPSLRKFTEYLSMTESKKIRTRRRFRDELKCQAVMLVRRSDFSVEQVGAELNVFSSFVYRRSSDFSDPNVTKQPSYMEIEMENRRLNRKLDFLQRLRAITCICSGPVLVRVPVAQALSGRVQECPVARHGERVLCETRPWSRVETDPFGS